MPQTIGNCCWRRLDREYDMSLDEKGQLASLYLGVRVTVRLKNISGTAFVFALGCGAGIGGVLAILWSVLWLGIDWAEGLAFVGAIVGAGITVAGAIYVQAAHARNKRATEIELITALFKDLQAEATHALGVHIRQGDVLFDYAGPLPSRNPKISDLGILTEKTRHISQIILSEAQHLHFHEKWALNQAYVLLESYLEFDQKALRRSPKHDMPESDDRDWAWAYHTLEEACRIVLQEFPSR